MKKVTDKKKLFMIVSICILCITLIGGTIAYYRTVLFADLNVNTITHGLDYYITYVGGQNIDSATLERVSDYTQTTSSTEITFYKKDNTYDIYGHIYLDINSIGDITSQSSALKYTVVNSTTGAKLSEGTLAGSKTNDSVLIAPNIPLQTTEELFKIYIWIDENEDIDPAMEGETLSLTVRCEATMKKLVTRLVDHLTNLYLKANPTQATVANNGINYYYAPSVSMMNDGMGSNHTWEDGANTGNIRYYGATPSNYIDIGDRDASGNVIPWRIIGVFKNMKLADGSTDTLVKVIRNEPIDNMAWHDDLANDWNNATLMTYLNEGEYYTSLSQDVKDKIAKVEWNLGGYDYAEIYSKDIYGYERGELKADDSFKTVWEGNIALMYPSDYGYATDLTNCTQKLQNYETDTTNCQETNWLFNGDFQWLLTPNSSDTDRVWFVNELSSVYSDYLTGNSGGLRAVLYLSSDLIYESGDGSEGNPYKLDPEPEKKENFVEYLTNKYMSANPTQATVANNGINYYYAPSVSMMNDGMNSNHVWEDGANTGNIRYYGATPANYIDIGDRDASGNVIPWRIIGVFKNMTLADGSTDTLVKVMRDESIGYMTWNDNGTNDWNNSTLKTYLNEGEYYTGLSQDVKDKIAMVEWNLGGYDDSNIYSNDIYKHERGELKADDSFETSWEGNIALMYPSDYGYAADLTKCTQTLYNYVEDTTNCIGTDWLFNSDWRWLLTPNSLNPDYAWYAVGGFVNYDNLVTEAGYVGVSAVLYLKSDLIYESGDGSSIANAYVVK